MWWHFWGETNKQPPPPPPPLTHSPPLLFVPDGKLHSCTFGKWQQNDLSQKKKKREKSRRCPPKQQHRQQRVSIVSAVLRQTERPRETETPARWQNAPGRCLAERRVTWSVWGVSVCPGPGWGLVWRSPEESGLGSASPGTPCRFAWRTDGRGGKGRGGGGRGVNHLSPAPPPQLVSFFPSPPLFFFCCCSFFCFF